MLNANFFQIIRNINTKWFLLALFVIGFLIRISFLSDNIFFGYEQGRDLTVVREIIENRKFTLIGPKTDIPGLFHGASYYYLLAVPHILSKGSPFFILCFLIFISCFSIPLIYQLVKELKDEKSGKIAAILFTYSFGAIVYSRWFANPPIAIPLIILVFLSIVKVQKYKKKWLPVLTISLGLLVHFEVVSFVFIVPALMYFVIINNNYQKIVKSLKISLVSAGLFLLTLSPYLLFDLRHDFLIIKGILSFLQNPQAGVLIDFLKFVNLPLAEFSYWVGLTLPNTISLLCLLLLLIIAKNKIVTVWVISVLIVSLFFSKNLLSHFYLTIGPVFLILLSLVFSGSRKITYLGTVMFVVINLTSIFKNLPTNNKIFFQAGQRELYFKDEIKTIDYIYKRTNNENFSIHPYTIPYFKNEGWDYLFNWYGKKKYGYVPITENAKTYFLIYQQDEGQPWFLKNWLDKERQTGNTIGEARFGIITVEERQVN